MLYCALLPNKYLFFYSSKINVYLYWIISRMLFVRYNKVFDIVKKAKKKEKKNRKNRNINKNEMFISSNT